MTGKRWAHAALFLLCLGPLAWIGRRYWLDDLTANPIEYITHFTGDWTMRFLCLTLAVTPLRRLLRWNGLLHFRRMLGLYAFFYGMLHFLTWFWLDKYFDWQEITADVMKRRFITVGVLGLVAMALLAVTSTKGWVRRLGGQRWQRLHRLVYVAAVAGVVHYYWLVKSDVREPVLYGAIVAILLAARLVREPRAATGGAAMLTLSAIRRETADTVTLRFPLPGGKPLDARPGQFLTFDWMVDGKKLPRSYSLSSSPRQTGYFEITVKQQGVVSTFLNRDAQVGLEVEAHGPFGQFCFDETSHSRIVLFAGGSGITPIMSMLRYIDEIGADTDITLFYSVRTLNDVIFQQDIDTLRKRLPRLRVILVLTQPDGHINRELVEKHLPRVSDQTFFLCGPTAFMSSVHAILMSFGVDPQRIRQESFTVNTVPPEDSQAETYSVEFAKTGVTDACAPDETLLMLAERHGIDIPYECRVGECGTCATRVVEGHVKMAADDGLTREQRAEGFRLMCVGRPTSDVRLDA